jgi:hypothetical protein
MIDAKKSVRYANMMKKFDTEQMAEFYQVLVNDGDLESFFESVQKHQQHDQSTHGSWAGTNQITSEQKKAVQAYTQKIGDVTQWRTVAQNIRDGKPSDAAPEFVSSVKTLLNAIDEHSVTPTNAGGKVLLRSGVNWKGKLPVVGEIMSNPVASATWRHNVAEKFASSGDGKPVIIKYGSNTKGLDTSKFGASLFGDEGEFIVSGKFEVVNRDKENGFTYVSVRPVSDVSKHQQHDQSSHGNWATDGSYPTEAVVSTPIYEAVWNYTNSGYMVTNNALRLKNPTVENTFTVQGMDLVIKATPGLTEDKTLLRGVYGGIANKLLDSKVGDGFQDNGYMSTTGNVNVAKFFSANQSDDYAIMVLDVPKGTKAFQPRKFFIGQDDGSDLWGALQQEDEYILARGTKFQITGIDKETRTVNVKVRT